MKFENIVEIRKKPIYGGFPWKIGAEEVGYGEAKTRREINCPRAGEFGDVYVMPVFDMIGALDRKRSKVLFGTLRDPSSDKEILNFHAVSLRDRETIERAFDAYEQEKMPPQSSERLMGACLPSYDHYKRITTIEELDELKELFMVA